MKQREKPFQCHGISRVLASCPDTDTPQDHIHLLHVAELFILLSQPHPTLSALAAALTIEAPGAFCPPSLTTSPVCSWAVRTLILVPGSTGLPGARSCRCIVPPQSWPVACITGTLRCRSPAQHSPDELSEQQAIKRPPHAHIYQFRAVTLATAVVQQRRPVSGIVRPRAASRASEPPPAPLGHGHDGAPGGWGWRQHRRGLVRTVGSRWGRELRAGAAGGVLSVSMCSCRHGQLGHGTLESEAQPRLVEALAGVPMVAVAAGGWHSATVSGEGLRPAGPRGSVLVPLSSRGGLRAGPDMLPPPRRGRRPLHVGLERVGAVGSALQGAG